LGRQRTTPADSPLVVFPAHALLILEERLAEQEAEGVEMPEGMDWDELALRILVAVDFYGAQAKGGSVPIQAGVCKRSCGP
jgi:hypothetical protein